MSTSSSAASPDYAGLVKYLIQPFLESPDSLRIDCETSSRNARVLIRVAFEGEDKGRVFGRGGRNIQAIRTVVQAIAQAAGHQAHLEVFGSGRDADDSQGERHSDRQGERQGDRGGSRPPSRRPSRRPQ